MTDAEIAAASRKIARERYAADHAAWVEAGRKSFSQQCAEGEARDFPELVAARTQDASL